MRLTNWSELLDKPAQGRELTGDGIHVWQASLAVIPAILSALERNLSNDERSRASRFRFQRDRDLYVVSRGLLRQLLACYSGTEPSHIQFSYGRQGKPNLLDPGLPPLRFNVSHSGDVVLLGFALGRDLGVDVEQIKEGVDFAGLAKTSFSQLEQRSVLALAPGERASLFYEYWSCKEACIKADGRGLSVPLDQFSIVNSGERDRWREVAMAGPNVFSSAWRVRILDGIPQYAAAVAAEGTDWEVQSIRLEDEALPR